MSPNLLQTYPWLYHQPLASEDCSWTRFAPIRWLLTLEEQNCLFTNAYIVIEVSVYRQLIMTATINISALQVPQIVQKGDILLYVSGQLSVNSIGRVFDVVVICNVTEID